MALDLINLDTRTRKLMVQEINHDIAAKTLYISSRLNPSGEQAYPNLLKEAFEKHDDSWLTLQLSDKLNATETRTVRGKITTCKVPVNAPQVLAEGEFNRFYLRGLCLRAVQDGIQNLVICRAKPVNKPRVESEEKIGTTVSPTTLLNDLRINTGVDTVLGLPSGPNSGLSARLP